MQRDGAFLPLSGPLESFYIPPTLALLIDVLVVLLAYIFYPDWVPLRGATRRKFTVQSLALACSAH
jgi:hypothetical protein